MRWLVLFAFLLPGCVQPMEENAAASSRSIADAADAASGAHRQEWNGTWSLPGQSVVVGWTVPEGDDDLSVTFELESTAGPVVARLNWTAPDGSETEATITFATLLPSHGGSVGAMPAVPGTYRGLARLEAGVEVHYAIAYCSEPGTVDECPGL